MSTAPTVPDELVDGISLGVYEKALAGGAPDSGQDWRAFLAQVPEAGFSFLDVSIDESPRRRARLEWDPAACRAVRGAAEAVGTDIGGVCLSVHRRIDRTARRPRRPCERRHVARRGHRRRR